MKERLNPAAAAAREEKRKRDEAWFRNRERQQRLQDALIVKSDEALIEEALGRGRITKCSLGATSESKSKP